MGIILVLQIKKPRPQKGKWFIQGHKGSKLQSRYSNQGNLWLQNHFFFSRINTLKMDAFKLKCSLSAPFSCVSWNRSGQKGEYQNITFSLSLEEPEFLSCFPPGFLRLFLGSQKTLSDSGAGDKYHKRSGAQAAGEMPSNQLLKLNSVNGSALSNSLRP